MWKDTVQRLALKRKQRQRTWVNWNFGKEIKSEEETVPNISVEQEQAGSSSTALTNKKWIDAPHSKQHNDHDWTLSLHRGPPQAVPSMLRHNCCPLHLVQERAWTCYPRKQDEERGNDIQTDPLPIVPTLDQTRVWNLGPQRSQGDPRLCRRYYQGELV